MSRLALPAGPGGGNQSILSSILANMGSAKSGFAKAAKWVGGRAGGWFTIATLAWAIYDMITSYGQKEETSVANILPESIITALTLDAVEPKVADAFFLAGSSTDVRSDLQSSLYLIAGVYFKERPLMTYLEFTPVEMYDTLDKNKDALNEQGLFSIELPSKDEFKETLSGNILLARRFDFLTYWIKTVQN